MRILERLGLGAIALSVSEKPRKALHNPSLFNRMVLVKTPSVANLMNTTAERAIVK